ncbi:hypothetical protein ACFCWG_27335, partial [Streptomyces sp. NPDC056390]|uniref:hypothetical protein n=1 Tax=Streptomyces sp. NPDC056390 TaxID=3345806 RepID=UPI0035DC365A
MDDDPDEEPAPRERRRPRIELSRTSLADALAALTPKQRWLLIHGTAAAAGWPIGSSTVPPIRRAGSPSATGRAAQR